MSAPLPTTTRYLLFCIVLFGPLGIAAAPPPSPRTTNQSSTDRAASRTTAQNQTPEEQAAISALPPASSDRHEDQGSSLPKIPREMLWLAVLFAVVLVIVLGRFGMRSRNGKPD